MLGKYDMHIAKVIIQNIRRTEKNDKKVKINVVIHLCMDVKMYTY